MSVISEDGDLVVWYVDHVPFPSVRVFPALKGVDHFFFIYLRPAKFRGPAMSFMGA